MNLSLTAIAAGFAVSVVASALIGLVFGAAIIADADPEEQPAEDALHAAMTSRGVLAQITILSLVVALLSGAVTGWLAPAAPILNAAIVGTIGMAMGLVLPAPEGIPPALRIVVALATLPVTMLGGWALAITAL